MAVDGEDAPADASIRGTVIDGRFELLEAIGRGASGQVYAARDRSSGDAVAVKVLDRVDPEGGAARRLHREADLLARLHHPNIVALRAAGALADGRAYLAMERLEGHTLAQWLRRTTRLSVARLAPLLSALAAALDAAHEAGVVHGDVRASNVFLERLDGRVKLLDFGVARAMGDAPAAGDAEASPQADLRALGRLCFEVLAGEALPAAGPFHARLEPPVSAVLERALVGGVRAGFASAGELAEAFHRAAGLPCPGPASFHPPGSAPPPGEGGGDRDEGERFSEGRGSALPAEPPSWMPEEPLRLSSVPPPPPPPPSGAVPGRVLAWTLAAVLAALGTGLWWLLRIR